MPAISPPLRLLPFPLLGAGLSGVPFLLSAGVFSFVGVSVSPALGAVVPGAFEVGVGSTASLEPWGEETGVDNARLGPGLEYQLLMSSCFLYTSSATARPANSNKKLLDRRSPEEMYDVWTTVTVTVATGCVPEGGSVSCTLV